MFLGMHVEARGVAALVPPPGRRRNDAGFTAVELLMTVLVMTTMAAMVVPMMGNMLGTYKLSSDAHGVSNSVAMAKMRAASTFTQTRLFVSVASKSFHVDVWQKGATPGWVAEGGTSILAAADSFSFGSTAVAPPNTQTTIAEAPPCTDNAGAVIAGTACVVFNSRGLPVDATGAPTGIDAFYLTDGVETFGITVSATGMLRVWRTPAHTTPVWALQ
jgi:Tfp pilus assembly protein FimT